jgi:hypothetical protein
MATTPTCVLISAEHHSDRRLHFHQCTLDRGVPASRQRVAHDQRWDILFVDFSAVIALTFVPMVVSGANFGVQTPTILVGAGSCVNVTQSPTFPHRQVVCALPSGSTLGNTVIILQTGGDAGAANATVGYVQVRSWSWSLPTLGVCSRSVLCYVQCPKGTYASGLNCLACPSGQYTSQLESFICQVRSFFGRNQQSLRECLRLSDLSLGHLLRSLIRQRQLLGLQRWIQQVCTRIRSV